MNTYYIVIILSLFMASHCELHRTENVVYNMIRKICKSIPVDNMARHKFCFHFRGAGAAEANPAVSPCRTNKHQ